jgi:alpha-ribazole phosphatase
VQLYLVRHPEPSEVVGVCYGRRDVGVPKAAQLTAVDAVRRGIPARVLENAPVFTSPLSRCQDLARALTAAPTLDEDLLEIDFGAWEGLPWDSIPRAELDAWANDLWGYAPGGGESAQAVFERLTRFLQRVGCLHHDAVVAVTHAGVIRVALARAQGCALSAVLGTPIRYGSVHRITISDRMDVSDRVSSTGQSQA